jgi:hypothetical protein
MFSEVVEDCTACVADWTKVVGGSARAEGKNTVELKVVSMGQIK